MAEHRADGLQGEAVAKHLSGGGMAEDMRSRLGRLDAGAVHGPGRNLAHGLVRQALEGSDRGQEDLVVVHRGPVCQVVKEAVPNREAYYPSGLGLCSDTVVAERNRGVEPKPDTFDMAPGDYSKLAQRFLKSLHDEHPERWIIHLAQTPRFDEIAARAAFSATHDVHQDEAWKSLPDHSFVQKAADPDWLRIHSVMSDVLRHPLAGDAKEFAQAHKVWRAHWQSRGSVTPTNSRPSRGITTMFSTPSKPSPPGRIEPRRRAANAT